MANISTLFVALADPTRRKLFERLAVKSMPVGDLAKGLPVTRPAVSQHLKVLYDAGLVTVREDGTKRIYSLDPKGVEVMRTYLDRMWDRALLGFKAAIEKKD